MRIGWMFAFLTVAACDGSDTGDDDDDDDDDDGGGNVTRDFGQEFEDKYCDEYEDCAGTSDCTFPGGGGTGGTPNTTTAECVFDQQAADDCINADWECMSVEGFTFVIFDPACCAVCGGDPCPTTSL